MNEKRRLTIGFVKLLDLLMVTAGFAGATVLRADSSFGVSLARFLSMRMRITNFGLFLMLLLISHLILGACGLYHSRRLSRLSREAAALAVATTLLVLDCSLFAWLFGIRMIDLLFLTAFWILTTAMMLLERLSLRTLARSLRLRGRDLRYILILGTNARALAFAEKILSNPGSGYRLLGFIDDNWPGLAEAQARGMKIVCDYAGFPEFLRRNVVDEVAIYFPFGSFYRVSARVAELCHQHGVTMRLSPDLFDLESARWRAIEYYGEEYIATHKASNEFWPQFAKRCIDVIVSAAALLCLLPLMLTVAVAIRLSSPGPVFFLQERIGLNKRRFKIYKFRTMVPNAESLMHQLEDQNEVSGPVFKIRKDPRITRIGGLLRRTSIDELPQLINVLRGEMSLVGPRPLPVRDYEGFSEDWQRRRFSVKPGITCLWQVSGRSGISFDQWMRLDLQYLDEWSVWLDLRILARTVPAVLRGQGAA